MRKKFSLFAILTIILLGFQSCSSATDGEWICTDAQADGKKFDELNQSAQDLLRGYIGMSLTIDGNEYIRKQQTPLMLILNKGNMEISTDMKGVTFTDRKIAKGGATQWTNLPKELRIPIKYDILTLNDKEFKIRTPEENIYGVLLVLTYTKK